MAAMKQEISAVPGIAPAAVEACTAVEHVDVPVQLFFSYEKEVLCSYIYLFSL